METKIYCVLHFKSLSSFCTCHNFSIFSSFVIVFLTCNLDFQYLGLSFSVYVDITDVDCGCSSVSDRSFFVTVDGYLVVNNDVHCSFVSQ
jgi:hypothetical protein